MKLKFGGWRVVADALAPAMVSALRDAPALHDPPRDSPALCWVPLGRTRKRVRGFDQAEELARRVGRLSGLRVRPLLRRVVETAPQARRSATERRQALSGAFRAMAHPPDLVVLVDDVLTTGETSAECARVLMRAGAREVGLLTAARSLGGTLPPRCYNPAGLRPGSVVARETASR